MKQKKLPIGLSTFKTIIEENYYYVDKSLLIKELIDSGASVTILHRPRRPPSPAFWENPEPEHA